MPFQYDIDLDDYENSVYGISMNIKFCGWGKRPSLVRLYSIPDFTMRGMQLMKCVTEVNDVVRTNDCFEELEDEFFHHLLPSANLSPGLYSGRFLVYKGDRCVAMCLLAGFLDIPSIYVASPDCMVVDAVVGGKCVHVEYTDSASDSD